MRSIRCCKKRWLSALAIAMVTGLFAQTHSFRFFPVNHASFIYQGFVGNLGNHFFLFNRSNKAALDLYVYDTLTQTGITRMYPVSMDLVSVSIHPESISFIGVSNGTRGKLVYHFFEVNEQGELLTKKEDTLSVLNSPLRSAASADRTHILFYQYARKNNDSIYIQGSMIGMKGEVEKELMYTFVSDRERTTDPETFVDNAGNTHIVVYDKYNNYRLSTDLSLNSIYFSEDEIISETFTLEKLKLKTLRVFQNEKKNCIQVEGLYANGTDKITEGVYSIELPVKRRNELYPRFFPFSTEMIKAFKKGYSATNATIRNSLQLKEWMYSDNGSTAVMNLNSTSLITPGGNMPDNRRPFRLPGFDDNGLIHAGSSNRSLLLIDAKSWNAPKQIFVKMGKGRAIEWQFVQKLDFFAPTKVNYNNVFLVNGEEEKITTVLYQADKEDEPYPVLVFYENGQQVVEKFPEQDLVFSALQFLGNNRYGSLYMNTATGIGGIMVIQQKDKALTHN